MHNINSIYIEYQSITGDYKIGYKGNHLGHKKNREGNTLIILCI